VPLNTATPLCAIEHVWDLVDLLLVMTVDPGFGGQRYLASLQPKIAAARGDRPPRPRRRRLNRYRHDQGGRLGRCNGVLSGFGPVYRTGLDARPDRGTACRRDPEGGMSAAPAVAAELRQRPRPAC
jgi:hypothetical protein